MSSERPPNTPRSSGLSGVPRALNLQAQTVGDSAILISLQPDVDRARSEHSLGRRDVVDAILNRVILETQSCMKSPNMSQPVRAAFELLLASSYCLLARSAVASRTGDARTLFQQSADLFRMRFGDIPAQRNASQLWTDYGIVLYHLVENEQAIEALNRSEATGAPPPEVYYFQAVAYRKLAGADGNPSLLEKARGAAAKGLQVSPGDPGLYCTLAETLTALNNKAGAVDSYVDGALAAARRNDLSATTDLLNGALRLDPAHRATVTLSVEVKRAQKRFDEALEIVGSAIHAGAGLWALAVKGKVLHDLNRITEAIALLEQVPIHRETAWVATELAGAYFDEKKYEKARELVDLALEYDSSDGAAQLLKGRLLIESGYAEDAVPLLESALMADADDPVIKFELGRAHFSSAHFAEAIARFDEVLRVDPESVDAAAGKAQACYRKAEQEGSADGFEAALSQARRTLRLDPGNHSMLDLVLDSLRALGRGEDALREMEIEISRKPESGRAWYLKGCILLDMGDPSEAAEALERAVKYDPGSADAHTAHANALRLIGHYDEAAVACSTALACRPLTAYALGWAGIYYGEVGDFSRACDVLQEGTDHFPAERWLWSSLGWALQYRDDQSAAASITAYKNAIKYSHGKRDIWSEKGLADGLYLAGRFREAAAKFRNLLTEWTDMDDVSVTYVQGWSRYRLGEYKEAAALLKKAADTSEYFLFAQFDYGLTMLVNAEDGVWAAYERALAQAESVPPLRQRGLFYVAVFDILEAARHGRIEEAVQRRRDRDPKYLLSQTGNLISHMQRRLARLGADSSALPWMKNVMARVTGPA